MDSIPEGFAPASFSSGFLNVAGPYYTRKDDDHIAVGIRITEGHLNGIEVAHGGVLTTLADVALSYQLFVSEKPRLPIATINLNTNFLTGAKLGDWVVAHAHIDRKGKRTAYCHGEIFADERLLMTMTGVFALLRK
ncbi:PaaI family thioesterase [Parasphingorhabdus cellanae]|uniref:PaaI family thioesterase n=1 Tax=Parasphingorhabdus cellanae TaxID=2806553 RepID=A0ABX7T4K9_9SPHN|nr:PaaI family thioesterase [Parasphingorhabdus cellanae]QTD55185.1 PaaI family thioesterase [Parasphingorhabdus cellanae]